MTRGKLAGQPSTFGSSAGSTTLTSQRRHFEHYLMHKAAQVHTDKDKNNRLVGQPVMPELLAMHAVHVQLYRLRSVALQSAAMRIKICALMHMSSCSPLSMYGAEATTV